MCLPLFFRYNYGAATAINSPAPGPIFQGDETCQAYPISFPFSSSINAALFAESLSLSTNSTVAKAPETATPHSARIAIGREVSITITPIGRSAKMPTGHMRRPIERGWLNTIASIAKGIPKNTQSIAVLPRSVIRNANMISNGASPQSVNKSLNTRSNIMTPIGNAFLLPSVNITTGREYETGRPSQIERGIVPIRISFAPIGTLARRECGTHRGKPRLSSSAPAGNIMAAVAGSAAPRRPQPITLSRWHGAAQTGRLTYAPRAFPVTAGNRTATGANSSRE